jgi:hypothetical protein
MERLIARPIPDPWLLVVKKALKIWPVSPGNPTPASVTEIRSLPFSSSCDLSVRIPPPYLHRLDRVEHKVHQHLLQLYAVGGDLGEIDGEIGSHRDCMPVRLPMQQPEHLADDFVYVDQLTL